MKIRIKGNSVRLRLTKSEVATFAQTGFVEEWTNFGSSKLGYVLRSGEVDQLTAQFETGIVTVWMPRPWALEWTETERVGFEGNMPLPGDQSLYLLIEKDFVCLDDTNEDQSDNYPNPLADQHR